MWKHHIGRRLKSSISVLSALALVLPIAIPGQAKAGKVSEIQCSSPLSDRGKTVNTTLTMKKGKSFQIKTKYAGKQLIYKSSKKKVAAVSKKGKIKAKKIGKARIIVSPKGNKKVKAVITVTVVKSLKKVKKIKLDKKALSLEQGKTGQLKAVIVSPKKPTTKKINWFSSNKKIASVNKKGVVTAKSTGTATITVAAADGQGAKANCKVTVTAGGGNGEDTGTSKQPPSNSPAATTPGSSATPTSSGGGQGTPVPDDKATVSLDAGGREGIKQGEKVQLSAKNADTGALLGGVQWQVSEVDGVSIDDAGLLTIAKNATVGATVKVTVKNASSSDSKEFTIIENKIPELKENETLMNKSTAENPLGLIYRTGSKGEKAFSTVVDPERGEVIKFDSTVGYTSNSYDMLAWMEVDPVYAGKTVTISAYIKYDENPEIKKDMNLIINENWNHSNPAKKWNAKAGEWHYITGTFKLPEYDSVMYDGNANRLYITKDSDLSKALAVYYLDDLSFVVEKADVDKVEISTKDDATEIFQNHDLQCSAEVTGTGNPSQMVTWSIEPPVEGAKISDTGKLTVENAKAGAEINIKATSKEDTTKSGTKKITVRAQTIDSITVSAKDNVKQIYQNNELQFTADVTSAGGPDGTVKWSVSPSNKEVEITEEGLLKVRNVAGGTKLTVKATSVFDKTKSGEYEILVLANEVNKVTIETVSETVAAGTQLMLSARLDVTGTPSDVISWSLPDEVAGVSLKSTTGFSNTLIVGEEVGSGTKIKVRATSEFDKTKFAEIEISVTSGSLDVFDINNISMECWEDFEEISNDSDLESKCKNITYTSTGVDMDIWGYAMFPKCFGKIGTNKDGNVTNGMGVCLNQSNDNIQFSIENTGTREKTYLVSFMVRFYEILYDTADGVETDYELPLKLVSVDESGQETSLKTINLPYLCKPSSSSANKEFYEMISTVEVPAGKTLCLRLKLNGELPSCCDDYHDESEGANDPHPVYITVDNVAISSGNQNTLTLSKGDTFDLDVKTMSGDTVKYYTNCGIAKATHEQTATSCPNFGEETIIAEVDETGKVTAKNAGETILIAEITHTDGTVDRKQCIVHVDN